MNMSNIATIDPVNPPKHIRGKSDWINLTDIKGAKSRSSTHYTNQYGKVAVYQVALVSDIEEIGDKLIHEKIGYTGKSTNIFARLLGLKGSKHNASPFIRNTFENKDLVIRILFVDEIDNLDHVESYIHKSTEKLYGYRFAWKEASGGIDGIAMRIQDLIDRIENLDTLKELMNYTEERANEIWRATWRNEE